MGRMTLVSRAWAMLPPEVVERWRRYAEGRAVRNPATGAIVVPRAYNEFCRLAGKARQVDAGFDLSAFGPPERAFTGDGVVVEVTGNALPLPTLPGRSASLPGDLPLQDKPLGEGVLRFSADRANAPGVVTELLVQPLVNAYRRSYSDRYASAGFHAFAGPGEVAVPVKAGAVACAYQFVVPATGQEGALVELGTVVAG